MNQTWQWPHWPERKFMKCYQKPTEMWLHHSSKIVAGKLLCASRCATLSYLLLTTAQWDKRYWIWSFYRWGPGSLSSWPGFPLRTASLTIASPPHIPCLSWHLSGCTPSSRKSPKRMTTMWANSYVECPPTDELQDASKIFLSVHTERKSPEVVI